MVLACLLWVLWFKWSRCSYWRLNSIGWIVKYSAIWTYLCFHLLRRNRLPFLSIFAFIFQPAWFLPSFFLHWRRCLFSFFLLLHFHSSSFLPLFLAIVKNYRLISERCTAGVVNVLVNYQVFFNQVMLSHLKFLLFRFYGLELFLRLYSCQRVLLLVRLVPLRAGLSLFLG